MPKAYSGLSRIGFSDTETGTITWLGDAPSPDSALNIATTETESTTGVRYGGQNTQTEIKLLGRQDYNTLETLQISDTRKYIHVEFVDGRGYVTRFPVNIMVNEDHMFNARDGISTTTFKFTKYTKDSPFKLKGSVTSGALLFNGDELIFNGQNITYN